MQIGSAEPPVASFLFVLSFYGESLGGRGYVTVLRTDALQAPLDRARGELSSDSRTLIFHLKIICGKIGEIWRSEIAIVRQHAYMCIHFSVHRCMIHMRTLDLNRCLCM